MRSVDDPIQLSRMSAEPSGQGEGQNGSSVWGEEKETERMIVRAKHLEMIYTIV